ncbi:hypothetical protein RIF29_05406 [Crotalaria pallida]|uniref:Uncharacterized protein n=1 Tax=Crotalaria pallida TaxID=3830 RepID=A0AAN9J4K5_CROPI
MAGTFLLRKFYIGIYGRDVAKATRSLNPGASIVVDLSLKCQVLCPLEVATSRPGGPRDLEGMGSDPGNGLSACTV